MGVIISILSWAKGAWKILLPAALLAIMLGSMAIHDQREEALKTENKKLETEVFKLETERTSDEIRAAPVPTRKRDILDRM